MTRVHASTTVPGRAAEAEELWYDPYRWAAWIDGFGSVVKLEGAWPEPGARLVWDSRPKGRGRVQERVVAYEPRTGSTLEVEDDRLTATQTVAFEPIGEEVRVTLTLDYRLKEQHFFTAISNALFIRRELGDSLARTLKRFGHERRAEITGS